MTFADETAAALYATVCERPECDTARLVLADRLDEAGQCERAEFIRVQCAIHAIPQCPERSAGPVSAERAVAVLRWQETHLDRLAALAHRDRELKADHPEWRKCPCPALNHSNSAECSICRNTGDLFVLDRTREDETLTEGPRPRTITFSRGFPDSVECTAADVWREGPCPEKGCEGGTIGRPKKGAVGGQWLGRMCDRCDGTGRATVPTEWAKAVVRETPVTTFLFPEGHDLIIPPGVREFLPPVGHLAVNREEYGRAFGKWVRAAAYPAAPVG